jgi:GTP1/Obg family GTP-binding protein
VNQLTTSDEISVYRLGLKLLREISDFRKFQKLVETLYYSLISSSGLDDETKRQIASDYIKTLRSSLECINSTEKEVEKTTKIVETFILDIKGSRFEELLLSLVNEYKASFNSLIKTVKDTLNEVNRMGFDLGIVRN